MSKSEIARKYGVGESTVRGWVHTRDYFMNKCLEIAKIASEGKLTVYCRIANINRKNYYDFLKQTEKPEDEEILVFIKEKQISRNYGIGYRPMTDLVRQKFKINISGKKVLKLMKENALLSTVRRNFRIVISRKKSRRSCFSY